MSTTSKVPLTQLADTLKRYSARLHDDVSTTKGKVFFSAPLKKWILVMRKGNDAFLTFSDDCPCSEMGKKY